MTIHHCTIENNWANCSGGIHSYESSSVITDCDISSNSATSVTGGIRCEQSSMDLGYSVISYNSGVGFSCDCAPSVYNCLIYGNTNDSRSGGIYCGGQDSSPTIRNCIISGNSSDWEGGGIYCYWYSSPVIENCVISENTSGFLGGGLYCVWSSPTITNCTFSANTASWGGGAICFYDRSYPVVRNCILWGDAPEEIWGSPFGSISISYSDVQGGREGEGNIDLDPRFAPAFHGFEYLLKPNSPCIDAGDPFIEDKLYDSHPRWPEWYPNGVRSDMGAYGGPNNIGWLR